MRRHGKNTLSDRGDGTEEEVSLNQLFEGGDTNEILDKDFVFQLRAILTRKSGYNLRNLYTHGLLSEDALHSHGLSNLWWPLFRMVLLALWVASGCRRECCGNDFDRCPQTLDA